MAADGGGGPEPSLPLTPAQAVNQASQVSAQRGVARQQVSMVRSKAKHSVLRRGYDKVVDEGEALKQVVELVVNMRQEQERKQQELTGGWRGVEGFIRTCC